MPDSGFHVRQTPPCIAARGRRVSHQGSTITPKGRACTHQHQTSTKRLHPHQLATTAIILTQSIIAPFNHEICRSHRPRRYLATPDSATKQRALASRAAAPRGRQNPSYRHFSSQLPDSTPAHCASASIQISQAYPTSRLYI